MSNQKFVERDTRKLCVHEPWQQFAPRKFIILSSASDKYEVANANNDVDGNIV